MNKNLLKTIRDRILYMEYSPGQILNEKELAKEFGVSRTPVREILNRLEWEQLVRILPRSGTIVTQIELQKMIHVYQIRFETEEMIGRMAAANITDDQLEEIRNILTECNNLFEKNDRRYLINLDLRFREVLYSATNNPMVRDIGQYLYNLTLRVWYGIFNRGDWAGEVREFANNNIGKTYDALSRRDVQESGKARQMFISGYLDRLKSKF
jgi:DNA-binding GntR family transcriptional regulator